MVAALTVTLVGACTADEPKPETVASEPGEGGTVHIYMQNLETLDPQRLFVSNGLNVSNLITRTLTTFKQEPGKTAKLVGDLATGTGTSNDDNTAWTFTLRKGVKWQDGTTVNCDDVRYGVLRNFDSRREDAAVITGGPPYPSQWLDVAGGYMGPKKDKSDKDVGGVVCEDKRTVRFELKQPRANFPSAVALPAFSPVPEESDSWEKYGDEPVANGPYKLESYNPSEQGGPGKAVFERNRFWDSKTDDLRTAKPDKIIIDIGGDPVEVAQQIITGNPDYDNAVLHDSVPSKFVSQVVNDEQLQKQSVSGSTSAVRYMSINTQTVSDLDCRRALRYAFNKSKYMEVYGGGEAFGDYATTMLPPSDPAYKDIDVYGLGNKPEGDLDKARELMDQADKCPKSLTLDVVDNERGERLADTVVETYGRLGITIELNKIKDDFFKTLSYPKNSHDLTLAAWIPDWPGGSGVIPALFHGDSIKPSLNTNYAKLDDPEINDAIDAAVAETDRDKAYEMWGDLDEAIQKKAAVVPIVYAKVLSLAGEDVRGAYLNAQWGGIDIASLGVKLAGEICFRELTAVTPGEVRCSPVT